MFHHRYDQISSAKNKNFMSIEISILQAVNTKSKSDVPNYLKVSRSWIHVLSIQSISSIFTTSGYKSEESCEPSKFK